MKKKESCFRHGIYFACKLRKYFYDRQVCLVNPIDVGDSTEHSFSTESVESIELCKIFGICRICKVKKCLLFVLQTRYRRCKSKQAVTSQWCHGGNTKSLFYQIY